MSEADDGHVDALQRERVDIFIRSFGAKRLIRGAPTCAARHATHGRTILRVAHPCTVAQQYSVPIRRRHEECLGSFHIYVQLPKKKKKKLHRAVDGRGHHVMQWGGGVEKPGGVDSTNGRGRTVSISMISQRSQRQN